MIYMVNLCDIIYNTNFIQVLVGISTGIVTIYIPFALILFQNWHNEERLNKLLALDGTIKPKSTAIGLMLLFLPLILILDDNLITKVIFILFWSCGLYLSIKGMFRIFEWIKNDRHKTVLAFLRVAKFNDDIVTSLRTIWSNKDLSDNILGEYFKVFKIRFEELYLSQDKNNIKLSITMISDLRTLTEKRPAYMTTFDGDIFESLLKWHSETWQGTSKTDNTPEDVNRTANLWQIYQESMNQIKIVIDGTLKSTFSYSMFKKVEQHIEINKNNIEYINTFYHMILREFFDKVETSKESYDIWQHYFPQNLKYIYSLENSDSNNIIFAVFLEWFRQKITDKETTEDEEKSFNVDKVAKGVFPDIDTRSFLIFLEYLMRPYGDNRTKQFLDRRKSFGLIDFTSYSYSGEEKSDAEVFEALNNLSNDRFQKTMLILRRHFRGHPNNISTVRSALEDLKLPEFEAEKYKYERDKLVKIFDAFLVD